MFLVLFMYKNVVLLYGHGTCCYVFMGLWGKMRKLMMYNTRKGQIYGMYSTATSMLIVNTLYKCELFE